MGANGSFQKQFFKNFTLGISPSVPLSVLVCAYWPPSSLLVHPGGKSVSNPSAVTTTDRPWFKACQSHSQTLRSARDSRPRPIQTDLFLLLSVINVSLFLTPSSENTLTFIHARSLTDGDTDSHATHSYFTHTAAINMPLSIEISDFSFPMMCFQHKGGSLTWYHNNIQCILTLGRHRWRFWHCV